MNKLEKILIDNGFTPNHKGFISYQKENKTPTYKWVEEIVKDLGYTGNKIKVYTTNTVNKYANHFTLNGNGASLSYFSTETKSQLIFDHIMGIKEETYNKWLKVINEIDELGNEKMIPFGITVRD